MLGKGSVRYTGLGTVAIFFSVSLSIFSFVEAGNCGELADAFCEIIALATCSDWLIKVKDCEHDIIALNCRSKSESSISSIGILPNQDWSRATSELPGGTVGVCSFHRRRGQLPYNLPITHLRFTPRSLFTCAF